MVAGAGVVIVGGGQAGGRAALTLRSKGFEDPVILIGDEIHAPYERPPLSKSVLLGKTEPSDAPIATREALEKRAITCRFGETVDAIDQAGNAVVLADGSRISYNHLILATGGRARGLPLPGADLPGVHQLRTAEDALAIRDDIGPGRRVVIIGGGFIGLEVAASARQAGSEVTVLEAADRILGRSLPSDAAETIAAFHRGRGVVLHTGVRPRAFEVDAQTGRVGSVRLAGDEVLPCDAVVIGIGIAPDIGLAEAAGLTIDNGIVTDSHCRTGAGNIWAIGDCAAAFLPRYGRTIRLESFQNADRQAQTAAATILGGSDPYDPVPWLWSTQYDWTLQTAGFPGDGDRVIRRGGLDTGNIAWFALRDGAMVGVAAFGLGGSIAKDVRLARMLIEKDIRLRDAVLADPKADLRQAMKDARG